MYYTDSKVAAIFGSFDPEERRLIAVPLNNRKRALSLLEGLRRARKGAVVELWYGDVSEEWDSGDWRAAETEGVAQDGRLLPDCCYVKVGSNRWLLQM
jgi:hypothetical protein